MKKAKKKTFKKIQVLVYSILFLLIVIVVYATTQSYQLVHTGSTEIDLHGVPKQVINNCGLSIFIPTKTSNEWSIFRTNKPSCVTVSDIPSVSGAVSANGGIITKVGGYKIHTFRSSGTFTSNIPLTADVLVVAGGGGGAGGLGKSDFHGGGGGGGMITKSSFAIPAGAYPVTVGAGGSINTNGYNSVFSTITAIGGGKGGHNTAGSAGGNGGGGSQNNNPGGEGIQGYYGGTGANDGPGGALDGGGGGGGASTVGKSPGSGGSGRVSSISGSSVIYAGGGGGAGRTSNPAGGEGGGGYGACNDCGSNAAAGTPNTGGGGGGGLNQEIPGAGGSGIVIIRYIDVSPCDIPWGGAIAHGETRTAFASSSVSCGSSCTSQTRTCNNGVLSGSYQNPSCSVAACSSCSLPWGSSIPHGSTVTAFQSSLVSCGSSCSGQTRTCNNGVLSGSYGSSSCSVAACASCGLPWGGSIGHGESRLAFASSSVSCGSSCSGQTRTCNNGVLSGSYTRSSCSVRCLRWTCGGSYCTNNPTGEPYREGDECYDEGARADSASSWKAGGCGQSDQDDPWWRCDLTCQ